MARIPSFSKGDFLINNKGCEAVIIDYLDSSKILVEFLDENRFRRYFEARDIREGVFKNPFLPTVSKVAYLGDGIHKTRTNGKPCRIHKVWSGMFTRCYYDLGGERYKSYRDCEVHKDWHNFQNFADWYKMQKFYDKGYDLDKDILVKGNRLYSAETCCLVPPSLNNSVGLRHNPKGKYAAGVRLDRRSGKFNSSISKFGKEYHLGVWDNESEASVAYLSAKKEYMRELAMIYKDKVSDKVFNALFNWEV